MQSNPSASVSKNTEVQSGNGWQSPDRLAAGMVETGTLPNGLRIITNHVPYVHSVTLGIWINAGSRDDPEGLEGLAHFIEHAVFKGTRQRNYVEIARCIEQTGGYIDAWTTKEQTCLYVRCLREHLRLALDLLADLVCNPVFPPGEIRKEKDVVLEEISSVNDTPEELIYEDFEHRSFPGHPLGTPILGSKASIGNMTDEAMRSFMKQRYVPENMLVTAVGSVEHRELNELAESCFSALKPSGEKRPGRKPFLPSMYIPFNRSLKKNVFQTQILLGTVIARNDRHFWSLMVLNTMLSSGMSSILNLELREKKGLVYQTYSTIAFLEEVTTFNIYAGTDRGKAEKTLETIAGLFCSRTVLNPDPAEIESAKSKMLGSLIMGMEKMTQRMSLLAQDLFYSGRYLSAAEKAGLIEAVTPGDIAEAAALLAEPSRLSSLMYKPLR